MASCSQTAQALVTAYNTWTLENIMDIRASNCINYILPRSLSQKPMNNEEYIAFFAPSIPLFRNFRLTIHDIVVDESDRKVVMHLTSTASTDIGKYYNEYMLKLHMTEDCRKVDKFEEFVDSGYSAKYMAKLLENPSRARKTSL
ncbi:MAG: hypothetical protein Q9172_001432 [Xanthocarpia lactea]